MHIVVVDAFFFEITTDFLEIITILITLQAKKIDWCN